MITDLSLGTDRCGSRPREVVRRVVTIEPVADREQGGRRSDVMKHCSRAGEAARYAGNRIWYLRWLVRAALER
ncbi:MAG TPA: hypothetical protein VGB85_00420, partial [Nannocystis sp.]